MEEAEQEILVEEFGTDNVTWNICQALEVKDNRLFCGNLKGTYLTIDTDFTVVSYNSQNQHHSYEAGNPNLYNDLMYSWGGLDFKEGGTTNVVTPPDDPEKGRYCMPEIGVDDEGNTVYHDMYRYIKGGTSDNTSTAFIPAAFTAPPVP